MLYFNYQSGIDFSQKWLWHLLGKGDIFFNIALFYQMNITLLQSPTYVYILLLVSPNDIEVENVTWKSDVISRMFTLNKNILCICLLHMLCIYFFFYTLFHLKVLFKHTHRHIYTHKANKQNTFSFLGLLSFVFGFAFGFLLFNFRSRLNKLSTKLTYTDSLLNLLDL